MRDASGDFNSFIRIDIIERNCDLKKKKKNSKIRCFTNKVLSSPYLTIELISYNIDRNCKNDKYCCHELKIVGLKGFQTTLPNHMQFFRHITVHNTIFLYIDVFLS